MNDCDADVVALTETWLSSSVSNDEIFQCAKQYKVFRCDRLDRRGGGVLLAVQDSIECFSVPILTDIESTWCCIRTGFKNLILGVCYRPPSSPPNFCESFHDCLNQITVRFPGATVILLGDFNFPDIQWSDAYQCSVATSSESLHFSAICSDFGLSQLVQYPTRVTSTSSSLLDLVFTSSPDLVSPITLMPGFSDHDIIHFSVSLPPLRSPNRFKMIRDYNKADFNANNNDLCSFLDFFFLQALNAL